MAAAAVVAVLVSGCGGDSEAATVTKAEYVKQANEICAERKKTWEESVASFRKEAEKKNAESNPKAARELADELVQNELLPAMEQQLEALEDLKAPEGKEKQAEKMVNTLAKEVDSVHNANDLFERGFADFVDAARDLGVKCPLL